MPVVIAALASLAGIASLANFFAAASSWTRFTRRAGADARCHCGVGFSFFS
jgi:hypothetical protein